ncbi:hypothetical protein BN2476_410005 [Paraburkholderia piptadeniae]|uniref:Uncharacterized protein n=1 Tax=Paraburkholderia piptadeniae TaxID=1701573 RepID=A0A1N7SAN9_9BURK|nr:hypothetical protein BN2476_410005 [Paraburkholderia piptadeniae]
MHDHINFSNTPLVQTQQYLMLSIRFAKRPIIVKSGMTSLLDRNERISTSEILLSRNWCSS